MDVLTHAFRDAFFFHGRSGFALVFDDEQSRAAAAIPFVAQKHDPGHLRIFVFEDSAAAEEDRRRFPPNIKTKVQSVSLMEVRAFTATGYFEIPVIVFLRDRNGDDTTL